VTKADGGAGVGALASADGGEAAGEVTAAAEDEGPPTEAAAKASDVAASRGADDEADRESLPSRASFTTTNPQKTVPGDRGESVAPTMLGDRGESQAPEAEPKKKGAAGKSMGLTADALAKHTAALAKAQAEAYAATFASAKSNYAKSVAGKSIAGKSITGKSIAGMSIAGKSIAGRSVAGRSIAASGIAPSEKTFRTHMTTRELLVGASAMRELMRSVSPISEPGVAVKRRRARSGSAGSSASPARKKEKKKKKKDKKVVLKPKASKAKVVPRMGISPSPYLTSPTPFRKEQSVSAAPSHWKGKAEPSADPNQASDDEGHRGRGGAGARPKKAQRRPQGGDDDDRWEPSRNAPSPCSQEGKSDDEDEPKKKKKKHGKDVVLRTAGDVEDDDQAHRHRKEEKEGKKKKRRKRSP